MSASPSVRAVLERHLQSILDCDSEAYHATTVPELTLYEWYVTPHRIDGLAFHDFLMAESARSDTPAIAPSIPEGIAPRIREGIAPGTRVPASLGIPEGTSPDPSGEIRPSETRSRERFDLANYSEQVYGDCAVCCYTLLVSRAGGQGTKVRSHHETRVLVRAAGAWKVVHVHKSPAWSAPYEPPT